jgi:CubicO group peptidase (beta-lactamase class C family)
MFAGCSRDGPLLTDVPVEKVSASIDRAIPGLMKEHGVLGLSVAVIRGGQISITKSFGYADAGTERKIDDQTIFRAASLGKPVFAYIVVSLAKQGKINLDVPLYSYFKEEVVEGDPRSRRITARMVLTHTTGLPNLDGKRSEAEFLFSPGTDFQYSGHAYLHLQKVVEELTHKNLNELADELVFQPLKMNSSSFIWQEKFRGRVSSSYDNSGEPFASEEKPMKGYSAWSLFTTVNDYARFVCYTIESSNTTDSAANIMMSPYVNVAKGVKWGLGWGLQDTTPYYSFWHWGSMAGFKHYVVGYPQERTAVIVMTNSQRAFKMVDDLMAKAIGGSYPSYDWF